MKVESDRQVLAEAHEKGTFATLGAYFRLSGPGWLQSAITLGGGSLASSLLIGVLAGFTMLWVQPIAMVLGIIMLSAIGYVTLSTGERPFQAINKHVNPVLGWGWALASLAANMVWCLPQFALATSVLRDNLLGIPTSGEGAYDPLMVKLAIVIPILIITVMVTWSYDSGSWGIRLYELVLKVMVAAIVLCFIGVVIRLGTLEGGLDWGAVVAGFVPDFSLLFNPAPGFVKLLESVPEGYRGFWEDRIVSQQRDVMISAAATAVGINMTFLLPYSLMRRGWTKEFRGLLRFDLATGMLIPFTLATSCVIIASATQFHPQIVTTEGEATVKVPKLKLTEKADVEKASNAFEKAKSKALDAKLAYAKTNDILEESSVPLTPVEREMVYALQQRQSLDLAKALSPATGSFFANIIFGLGVLGMALSTITMLMLISGLVITEIFDLPQTGWPYKLGCLAATTGALGPFVWSQAAFYLAIPTSVFGMALLPFAYLSFFFLMNQKKLLGENMPRGASRVAWNVLMFVAATTATLASLVVIWQKVGWIGIGGVIGLILVALVFQFRPKPELPVQGGDLSSISGQPPARDQV